ncbi:hypothetical protein D0399_06230 [Staphylococcus epidermidis]|uniref:glycoside hydrolase family 5 protein n=1 Tax=Staphylococcus epidermidis TaxID=1282 RepID=UPI0019328E18|nr:cellulase family glycosylhydrolase [Staphylococcus epidermidis]MBM0799892.1 hypothetical protein [Staphylococcus epidermidis]MDS3952748.1 cellulase family glycosylhydrolase [Staphylococcus epidermidis]
MKKTIITSIIAATTITSLGIHSNLAHAESITQLQTNGQDIQKDGQKFQVKGVNAGNVFTTENWLGGVSDAKGTSDYKELNDKLDDQYGAKKTHQILDTYANNRWKDQDFQNVKDMGNNTIRLPINYINLTNYKKGMAPKDVKMRKEPFKAMDNFIKKANDKGLYVIIDMHGAPNSQNAQEHSADKQKNEYGSFWNDPDSIGKAKEIWWNIADHYKNNPGVAGYDLLNEPKAPNGNVDKDVKHFYKDTLDTIRSTGDKHIAFLEAWHDNDLKDPKEFGKNRGDIVYEYHNYPYGQNAESNNGIKKGFDDKVNSMSNISKKYQVPTYLGEFNDRYAGDAGTPNPEKNPKAEDLTHIVKNLNKNSISWTLWNYDIQGQDNTWGAENFKGINVDENSKDFGEKIEPKKNEDVFNAIKDANG